jgi:hypothetical protein
MPLTKRSVLHVGGIAVASVGLLIGAGRAASADETPPQESRSAASAAPTQLSAAEVGNLIRAMGYETKLEDKRYDFTFKANYAKEEWNLSMSAVLSENGRWIWVMAWLDQCPRSAAEVPRTALLRLLAKNDTLGNGKFFAYIASNNRFVLQRVIPNEDLSTGKFRDVLRDLAVSVVETYPNWSVAGWKQIGSGHNAAPMPENGSKSAPAQPAEIQHTSSSGSQQSGYRTEN